MNFNNNSFSSLITPLELVVSNQDNEQEDKNEFQYYLELLGKGDGSMISLEGPNLKN